MNLFMILNKIDESRTFIIKNLSLNLGVILHLNEALV